MADNQRWRFEIQYGPDGEANYAWVYAGKVMVGTMRTHHAAQVVEAVNAYAVIQRAAFRPGMETFKAETRPRSSPRSPRT